MTGIDNTARLLDLKEKKHLLVKTEVETALVRIGDAARPILLEAAKSKHQDTRASAERVLQSMGHPI